MLSRCIQTDAPDVMCEVQVQLLHAAAAQAYLTVMGMGHSSLASAAARA